MFEYKRKMPSITADVICCRYDPYSINNPDILFIKRNKDPFKDCWAWPGGHFEASEDTSVIDCAKRELKEETGLISRKMTFFNYYDKAGRDPRGRYVDFVFVDHFTKSSSQVKLSDESSEYKWLPLHEAEKVNLAFDHNEIIFDFIVHLFKK